MQQLIEIKQQGGEALVDARELHAFLGIKSRFNDWIGNRLKEYGFKEPNNYTTFTKNLVNGGTSREYALKLRTAKEMMMVERNEQGRKAREYFIKCEEKLEALKIEAPKTEPNSLQPSNELIELIRQAILVCGSQAKLASRIGVSQATLSQILHVKPWQYTPDLLNKIAAGCRNVIAMPVISTDHQVLGALLNIDNKADRILLYTNLKKGGVL